MQILDVESQSQANPDALSVLARPILGCTLNKVVAVLYADSTKCNVFTDECVDVIGKMCQRFVSVIEGIASDRVANFVVPAAEMPRDLPFNTHDLKVMAVVTEQVAQIEPTADYLNLEFTDFVTLRKGKN